jgi:hypothetical protein
MGKNTIQEKIQLLNSLDIRTDKFNQLYEKIMLDLVLSKELYSIVRKNTDANEEMNIFCGLNNEKIPSVWIFTEESIAEEFTTYYKISDAGQNLFKKVTIEELTVFIFKAMFSGVSKLIIDEGRNTLITNIYDFVNMSLSSINKPPILKKQEYKVMDIFNQMKYAKMELWVIPSKKINGGELIFSEFIPDNDNRKIKIYNSQEKCKKESVKYGFEKGFAISMELKSLYKILENSYREKIENVMFDIDDYNINVDIRRVLGILQRMI